LQEIAPEAIAQLANEYPFFAPASYFLLINGQEDAAAFVRLQQRHPVNPVMLHHLKTAAATRPEPVEIVITEIAHVETKDAVIDKEVSVHITDETVDEEEALVIQPLSSEDYFLQQGISVSSDMPEKEAILHEQTEEEKALMVVMSFGEWLKHISAKKQESKRRRS